MAGLNEALNVLCDCKYPASIDDVRRECEDTEVTLKNGETTTLGKILGTVDEPPEQFESSTDLHNFLMSLAPEESIGRKYYDDRGSNVDEQRENYSI